MKRYIAVLFINFALIANLFSQSEFKPNGIIALLSDYGTKDFYVGAFKGSITKINPRANIIDITHEVNPFNVREGMFTLLLAAQEFPKGTIFIASVDPEVGTERRSVILETKDQKVYIAPDNGILTLVMNKYGVRQIREITNNALFRQEGISSSFAGRDIFGPVAANISNGTGLNECGKETQDYEVIPVKSPEIKDKKIIGEVIFIDKYGNIQANFGSYFLKSIGVNPGEKIKIKIGNRSAKSTFASSYGYVDEGSFVIFEASTDFMEIARNESSAEKYFNAKLGDEVEIEKIK